MKSEKISGIGSIRGGEIETLEIEGIGKLKGKANVSKKVLVEGLFKSKGTLTTNEFKVDGVARVFRDIKAKSVFINGILKLRRANLYSDNIKCDGVIISTKEVSADDIFIDGVCSVFKMYGDKITIQNKENGLQQSKIPTKFRHLLKLYFGRDLSISHSLVDIIECTSLNICGVKAKIIRANTAKLTGCCIVDKLYCDGDISIDDSCSVKEIISKNKELTKKNITLKSERVNSDMANTSLTKILELYKLGKINADEAEKMLESLSAASQNNKTHVHPWEDDGKLRVVAYIGRRLLKKGDVAANKIEVSIEGEPISVESFGNLTCKNVKGNASAGLNIYAANIDGNISCGGSITCESTKGKIAAGGGVHVQNRAKAQ